MRRHRWTPAAALILTGCTSGSPDDAAPAVADSAGIRIVTSGVRGRWGPGEELHLVPDLRIGSADGPPEYMFSQVVAVQVGAGDTMYVLDRGDKTVSTYDPQGHFVRRFGREGDGPGEFREPGTMALRRDGPFIYDRRAQRVTQFSWTGAVVSTAPVAQWTPFGSNLRTMGDTAFTLGLAGGYSAPPRPTDGRFWLVRFSTGGSVLDTLVADEGGQSVARWGDHSVSTISAPFPRGPRWDVAPDGRVAYGRGDAYAIDVYGDAPGFRLVTRLRRGVALLEATDADRESYREPYLNPSPRFPEASRRRFREMVESVTYPDTWPAYDQLLFDAAGRLWVRRSVHAGDSVIPRDVFGADGEYLGEVRFPSRLNILHIGADAVYGVERDEVDVPFVVRYRLVAR
jgi:hypothetical protein